jgi:integrase
MGYVAKKVRKKPDGSIYWQVVFEDRRKDRPGNIPREQPIHRDQLIALGIEDTDTFERVKETCHHLNSKANLEKKNERVRVKALARENHEYLIQSIFLPEIDVRAFEEKILFKRFAGDEAAAKLQRLTSHWKFTQRLIDHLEIEPKDYADESFQIYRYFIQQKISPAYSVKILRILNAWGQFFTKRHGGTGIEEVKMPRGKQRQDIVRAYQNKDGYKGEADPLTTSELDAKAKHLLDYNYNWLYLSVWLGLRPEEVDLLKDKKTWRIERDADGTTPILWVFQSKLTGVEEAKAWKPIPLIHPNQVTCLEIIHVGNFKRPLNKTLRKVFPDQRITGYSGRKGFTDLMQDLGQALEEISIWMGHHSIETTWKHYKQKQVVRFKRIAA